MHAAERGNVDILNLLIEKNANVNLLNRWQETALIYACNYWQLDCLKSLTKAKSDLNHQNKWGNRFEIFL